MVETYDVIVVGCGGFGSACVDHLSGRGLKVLGLDQFVPPHKLGSSHGETRVIRKAYFEHPDYVPLLHRAYELWDQLAGRTQETLFEQCGLLLAGPADGEVIAGARESANRYQLPIESLTHEESRRRFPVINVPEALDIVFEQQAGYLWAERCIGAHLNEACQRGARLRFGETVRKLSFSRDNVKVETDNEQFSAASLVVTSGAWTGQLLARYQNWIQVKRKTLFWLPISDARWSDPSCATIHLMDLPSGQFYGFPSVDGRTVKIGEHTGGVFVDRPQQLRRDVQPHEAALVHAYAEECLNGVHSITKHAAVCMYSMSPDGHFLLDRLPDAPVVVGAGFSGHGFKFTSVLGEAIADLVEHGQTSLPINFLSSDRLRSGLNH